MNCGRCTSWYRKDSMHGLIGPRGCDGCFRVTRLDEALPLLATRCELDKSNRRDQPDTAANRRITNLQSSRRIDMFFRIRRLTGCEATVTRRLFGNFTVGLIICTTIAGAFGGVARHPGVGPSTVALNRTSHRLAAGPIPKQLRQGQPRSRLRLRESRSASHDEDVILAVDG